MTKENQNNAVHGENGDSTEKVDDRHSIPTPHWTPEQLAARRKRGRVLGLILFALVVLFFLVTLVRLGGNVADRAI